MVRKDCPARAAKDTAVIEVRSTTRRHTNGRPWSMSAGLLFGALSLSACAHVQRLNPAHWHAHWPWQHTAPLAEPVVTELVVEAAAGAVAPTVPQTWDRNTLRVALNSVAGEGEFSLRPLEGHDWPIRLEFAVQPGAFAHLEVRGAQRVILSVPAAGGVAVLPMPLGVVAPETKSLTLHYGP